MNRHSQKRQSARHGKRLFCVALLVFACAKAQEVAPRDLPPYIQPLPGATHVIAGRTGQNVAVIYHLSACYPAAEQLRSLTDRIPQAWKPRKEHFLNPGVPTAQVRGWTRYYDGRPGKREWVHNWTGEWQQPDGAVVSYDLRYRTPGSFDAEPEKPTSCDLVVTGQFFTADKVRELKQNAARQ